MEKWSTVADAGEQDIKHRAMISILVAILQVYWKKLLTSFISILTLTFSFNFN